MSKYVTFEAELHGLPKGLAEALGLLCRLLNSDEYDELRAEAIESMRRHIDGKGCAMDMVRAAAKALILAEAIYDYLDMRGDVEHD